ncbi:MAG: acetate--CoA ligase family protein, partial [Nocardioides sp.]
RQAEDHPVEEELQLPLVLLVAADAAAPVGLEVVRQVPLGAEATADDFEDALDAAIDDPEVDAVIAVYIPPLNVSGEDVANVLAAVGEQSDKPLVSSFLGAEGVPELLRVPDVAGSAAGRGSVPSYPAVEAAVRAMASVVEYAIWLRTPDGQPPDPAEVDTASARRILNELLAVHPEGIDLSRAQVTELLATYGIELWDSIPVANVKAAQAAGKKLGWDVVLKATAEGLRERPDLAHVWRNIDSNTEMKTAWDSLSAIVRDPSAADFVVQKNSAPGVPVAIRSMEDPLFGPVVSFGISGPIIDLLADRAYRIPPLGERDISAMVREVKSSPILFGYRGAEPIDVQAIERLIGRVAQMQNDLQQLSTLELSLVLAGTDGATVLTASARVAPVADPRSDMFARRLPDHPGDTVPQ